MSGSPRDEAEGMDDNIVLDLPLELPVVVGRASHRSDGGSTRSVQSLDIRPDILRGACLSNVLKDFGGLWRTSPCDMPKTKLDKLHRLSGQCHRLDSFISHAWGSSWQLRYLALLMHCNWRLAAIAGVMAALVLFVLDVAGLLPTILVPATLQHPLYFDCQVNWPRDIRFCPWVSAPAFVSLVVLFIGPSFNVGARLQSRVFLDLVCINQCDEEIKQEGITSLAGFLHKSDELLVLWSPSNLDRAWCVYELAIFSALDGERRITWCPLFLYGYLFATFVATCVGFLGFELYRVTLHGMIVPFGAFVATSCAIVSVLLHCSRRFMEERHAFMEKIQGFDVRDAQCRMDSDREYIMESVKHWYGSELKFNEYVRGSIAKQMMAAMGWLDRTYFAALCSSFGQVGLSFEWIAAFLRSDISWSETVAFSSFSLLQCFCLLPIYLRLGWLLFATFRGRLSHWLADVALSALLGSFWIGAYYANSIIAINICTINVWVALGQAAAWVLLTLVVFLPRPRR